MAGDAAFRYAGVMHDGTPRIQTPDSPRLGRSLPAIIAVGVWLTLLTGFDVQRDQHGSAVRWPGRAVAVFVEARGHGAMTAAQIAGVARAAIKTWNDALPGTAQEPSTRLVWGGLVGADPRFDIFIRVATKGFTKRTENPTGRLRVDADGETLRRVRIELDAQHFTFSAAPTFSGQLNADLQAVLTHQLGHALGLGFSRNPAAALYYFVVTAAQRRLDDDDERGVRWLYGVAEPENGRLCDPCDGDQQCDGRCLAWPDGNSYCARDCVNHNDCPIGFSCGTWPGGTACLPNDKHCAPDKARAPVSGRCANDLACPNRLFCLASGGEGFCTAGCSGFCDGFGQCKQVQFGTQVVGLCMAGQNRSFGVPCEVAPDCGSLVCAPSIYGGGRCTQACAAGCPKGATCDADGGFCVKPGELGIGWPCDSGFDCASSLCVKHGGTFAKVCAISCTGPPDCPVGTGCTPTQDGMFCLPFGTPPTAAPCVTAGACGKGSVCDGHPMVGVGQCAPRCDPFATTADCPAGMRCAWTGGDTTAADAGLVGTCRASGAGGLAGAPCDATSPCRVDLVCAASAGAATCRAVCQGDTCAKNDACQALIGPAPQPKVCAAANTQTSRAATTATGQTRDNFAARTLVMGDLKPYNARTIADPAATGCGAGRTGRAPWRCLLLGGGWLLVWTRRRRRGFVADL